MLDERVTPPTSPAMDEEKASYEVVTATEKDDFEGLRVGGESYLIQAKKGVHGLSTIKKVLLGVLGVWVLGSYISKGSKGPGPHHHHRHHGHEHELTDPSQWFDESNAVTTYGEYLTPELYTMEGDKPIYIANATFIPTHKGCHRQIAIEIAEGVNAGVVIIREDVNATTLRVESAWYEENMGDNLQLVSSGGSDILRLSALEGLHSVEIVLPLNATRIPRLHLTGPSHPAILFETSATDAEFTHLHIESEKEIVLDQIVARDVHIKSDSGSVSGTFNVTNAIVFKTVTGDINATVNVQPQPPHNHTEGDHGHDHHKHKHGKKHHDDKKHHHKKDHHHDKKRGCAGGVWNKLRAMLPFKSGKHHGKKEHKHHHHHHKHHGPPPPPHPHHPHGPPPPPPHGPHHDHPHGPEPVFIGAFTSTGRISLTVNQPENISTITKAISHTGDVTVNGSKEFKGYFEAGTYVGNVSVSAGEGKEIEVIKEEITTVGGYVKGLIRIRGEGKDDDDDDDDDEDEDEDDEILSEWVEELVEEELEGRDGPHGDEPHGPPPPQKGPGGPPPPHKGPGGPPPPPPHKGPGGPHEHHRPPPPGFSKLFAKTDVGSVKVTL